MRRSMQIPVEVDCPEIGINKLPIAGYPLTCYEQNYENRNLRNEGYRSRYGSTPIHVEAHAVPTLAPFRIPKYRMNYIEKPVQIPFIQKIQKIVEIPEIREITKFVDRVKVVDIPVDDVRVVPKLQIREIEKIRHVPGPIQYVEIPQEHIVHKPIKKLVEKIHEIPIIEDIEVEVPIYVPTPVGPPEDIYIDIPLPYDVPQFMFNQTRIKKNQRSKCCLSNLCCNNETNDNRIAYANVIPSVSPATATANMFYSSPPINNGTITHIYKNEKKPEDDSRRHNFNDDRLFNYNGTNSNNRNNLNVPRDIQRDRQPSNQSSNNRSHFTFQPNQMYEQNNQYDRYDNNNNNMQYDNTYLDEEMANRFDDVNRNYVYNDNRRNYYPHTTSSSRNQYDEDDYVYNDEDDDQVEVENVTAELIVKECNRRRS